MAQPIKNYEKSNLTFTPIYEVAHTSIKNQMNSGTCWSFSSESFLESELMLKGKKNVDLSEMYVVRKNYEDKAEKYIRMYGKTNFGPGGEPHDLMNTIRKYGLMPQAAYPGKQENINHDELDKICTSFVEGLVKDANTISENWREAYQGILDAYLGKVPERFSYEGKDYTARSFADEMQINPDDYIELTSFTHHPFYQPFVLEVPDNWAWGACYNVPIEDLWMIAKESLKNNHSVEWASDVSEKGFNYRKGIAIVPAENLVPLTEAKRDSFFSNPIEEKTITQDIRQKAFDAYETQDDHAMHITGLYKDQNGKEYLYVKNSWGTANDTKGFFFCSESYFKYKTTCLMVHKDMIPKDLRRKLGI